MGPFRFFKRKPKQLEMMLGDQTRSLGAIDAERKARVLDAKEQIIERKKLQKTLPKLKKALYSKRTLYAQLNHSRDVVVREMELITNNIAGRRKTITDLRTNNQDLRSATRITTASKQDEMSTASNPATVPKPNTILQEARVKKQEQAIRGIEKEITKFENQYSSLKSKSDELSGRLRVTKSEITKLEPAVTSSEQRLLQLSN